VNPPEGMQQRASGLLVPGPSQGTVEERIHQALIEEVNQLVHWCAHWPAKHQAPLTRSDVMEAVLVRARSYLWPQDFSREVYQMTVHALGLKGAVQPTPGQAAAAGEGPNRTERRQAARAAARREARGGRPSLHLAEEPEGKHFAQEQAPAAPTRTPAGPPVDPDGLESDPTVAVRPFEPEFEGPQEGRDVPLPEGPPRLPQPSSKEDRAAAAQGRVADAYEADFQ
jgi:hypothetical protein